MRHEMLTMDGNEAAAYVAYRTNEVVAIYPITPASPIAEWADQWSSEGKPNLWGTIPTVVEMQSEAGAVGTVHGSLQAGALTTTFTASQGLLLMIPDMFKIAGELTPAVIHVAARTVATHALSIFCDHSDVMAVRSTGWGILFAAEVQEVMDFALIAQAASLESRVPFVHAFDGFRTSHEVQKIAVLPEDVMTRLLPQATRLAQRDRALSPDRPSIRGTAQNPDVFFQGREASNRFYQAAPGVIQKMMDEVDVHVGRQYRLFDYVGAPDADRVVIAMGSGCQTLERAVNALVSRGERVGLVKVRLFRPFDIGAFVKALPATVRAIAVLDRTKEAGSVGEPLYLDVVGAIHAALAAGDAPFVAPPRIVGGRYGLSSKEFTPAMAAAVFAELAKPTPKHSFTVGIVDDVTHLSIDVDPAAVASEPKGAYGAVFWGLGSDGTVGAAKNTIKIIGEQTESYVQGYFDYDSKKSGTCTVSHLRFGPEPIRSPYLISEAEFVSIAPFDFVEKYDVLAPAARGATVLLNCPYPADEVWDRLPELFCRHVIDKELSLYVVPANQIADESGIPGRSNTVMQACFFGLSGVLPVDEAMSALKKAISKTYGKRGPEVVARNLAAVDSAQARIAKVAIPVGSAMTRAATAASGSVGSAGLVGSLILPLIAGKGDSLPVSAMPVDGTFPVGTTRHEKRNLAESVPVWDEDLCIQCGKCVLVCPHAAIRSKVVPAAELAGAPTGFRSRPATWRELGDARYTLQVAVEDCTGCELCVDACPAISKTDPTHKSLNMAEQRPLREVGRQHWDHFLTLPEVSRVSGVRFNTVKDVQLLEPLFEFSGACSGCGETPYVKLVSQLFGDRVFVANATGCSSIYGGNLPTTPWAANREGRGPAWANSLFEDNAEFGLGMRLAVDAQTEKARSLVRELGTEVGAELVAEVLSADQDGEAGIAAQRQRVAALKERLSGVADIRARDLVAVADTLVRKSVWIIGGDGWAYDIGFGGLDHVLASGADVKILVLDTEVYSNTGGQASKSTPLGAVARFAASGQRRRKKDLGRIAMTYHNVYVAQVAMGASDAQTVKAFLEAEAHRGPALIVAYSHCIAHGIEMSSGMRQQKLAVASGHWPLYRFDPARREKGQNPMVLDSKAPSVPFTEYVKGEGRYRQLQRQDPETAAVLMAEAEVAIAARWQELSELASSARIPDRDPAPAGR